MPATEAAEVNPSRGRLERSEENRANRRRRVGGTLNRMQQMNLDIFDPEQLDLQNYVYRWVEDKPGRIRGATEADDYDFVNPKEITGFSDTAAENELSVESSQRMRQIVGEGRHGPIYAYLLRKPRWMWEDDQEAIIEARDKRLNSRIVKGEFTDEADTDRPVENAYVVKGSRVGSPGERRRGPIAPRK
jgi:hypothetical protein